MPSGPRLQDWASSPAHLQFNRFVLGGYRPVTPLRGCVGSLFYLHNELGNIYTHGIPLLYFLFLMPAEIPWSQLSVPWLAVSHCLACVAPQLGSVLYHLFMNHEGGAQVYRTLLTIDMCGICLLNTLGALPIIYATLLCRPALRALALLSYATLSLWVVRQALGAVTTLGRLRCFLGPACFRLVLLLLRWCGLAWGSPSALPRYLAMDGLGALGGLINAGRIPERWFPGAFDYCLNSHQIMHLLVVASIYCLNRGVLDDLGWISASRCPS
ncbi:progestin and adipoQ receptor family member 4a [Hemitrygon akajei]|uniref:progestin and adipoQ receptor family member 4a n=1 Tax=Hemitrygon akajei TaxID=2704970 RepID=UPI003BFA1B69